MKRTLLGSRSLVADWQRLRESVDRLRLEMRSSKSPLPTWEMCTFLIAGEDRRFWRHPGFDVWALCRAFISTYFLSSRQGGSTIAMQLVRTITGKYENTLSRKVREILLSIRLTRYVPREILPLLYLWVAYYGWRMNNFSQACSRLKISPSSVGSYEAAKLVARLKYPQPRNEDPRRLMKIHRRALYLLKLSHRLTPKRRLARQVGHGTVQSSGIACKSL